MAPKQGQGQGDVKEEHLKIPQEWSYKITKSVITILIGNIPYINLPMPTFYVKEELGDGSLLSSNYLSTAEIFV